MTLNPPARRVQRVRHELKLRDLEVVRVAPVSPHVRAITLHGESLADFVSASFDDHVKLFVPAHDGADPVARDYTPRRFDPVARALSIDFAADTDDVRNTGRQIASHVAIVRVGIRASHQDADIAPDHFVRSITEEPLARTIETFDDAARVDDDHGVDRGIEQRLHLGLSLRADLRSGAHI